LAEQFVAEFTNIKKMYYPNETREDTTFPLNKIIKRLEILKNYILLEDTDELKRESTKLKTYDFNSDLRAIIDDLNNKAFSSAINKIQNFVSKNQQLSVWTDPEIAALKLEIKNLENQLNAYDNEKIELEKTLSEFQHRHTIELGDLILEILKLRKLKFKSNKAKYEEAEQDEKQYREQVNTEREKEIFELTDEQRTELKNKFRKATKLCHPDMVSDEFADDAQKIFVELKQAYDKNDLKRVTEILEDIEKGNFFKSKSETILEKDLLKSTTERLRRQIKIIENEIISIKESETYKTIANIKDWDEYFSILKKKLNEELEELQVEM
jgi:hypothetical protein